MDAITERFLAVWGTPERGERLWLEWRGAFVEGAEHMLDTMAEVEAETCGLPIEEARHKLALEKFARDRGPAYMQKILQQHDAELMNAQRSLKPMGGVKKRK